PFKKDYRNPGKNCTIQVEKRWNFQITEAKLLHKLPVNEIDMKDLSIIYVKYKSVELIRDSIQSLFYHTSLHLQIIVVANSDEQTFFAPLKKEYTTDYINIGYNAGFARANHRGIQSANADIVLLLNPDTIILEDALDQSYYKLKGSSYV